MSKITIVQCSLRKLKSKLEQGDFAVPEIQRQFVWNKSRVSDLMDSIFNDYPVGASLIWRAPYSKALKLRPNHRSIIPSRWGARTDLIIDGQQRLSTIYGVLSGHQGDPHAYTPIDFRQLYFNCDPRAEKKFVFRKRHAEGQKNYIPLYELMNQPLSRLSSRLKLTQAQRKAAQKCLDAFASYKFCLIFYSGSGLEKDIREIFVRINSKGMTVSRADILFARANQVKLRELMFEARRNLKYGFNQISVDALQAALGPIYESNVMGKKGLERFLQRVHRKQDQKNFARRWKSIVKAYGNAVDFIVNDLGISKLEDLPTENLFTMLSFFFFLNGKRASASQTREIKKWFWHTACGNRYSGAAFNRNIPSDIKFFRRLSSGRGAGYVVSEKINPNDFLKTSYRGSGGALSVKAYFLMLRNKKPCYLDNGKEMLLGETSASSNRNDKHHIFPRDYLARKNVSANWTNAIVNICYLAADENQSISNKAPFVYLETYKRKRHFARVMKSNLIPYKRHSAVWDRRGKQSFIDFVNLRGPLVVREIERLAGNARLFSKFEPIRRV